MWKRISHPTEIASVEQERFNETEIFNSFISSIARRGYKKEIDWFHLQGVCTKLKVNSFVPILKSIRQVYDQQIWNNLYIIV